MPALLAQCFMPSNTSAPGTRSPENHSGCFVPLFWLLVASTSVAGGAECTTHLPEPTAEDSMSLRVRLIGATLRTIFVRSRRRHYCKRFAAASCISMCGAGVLKSRLGPVTHPGVYRVTASYVGPVEHQNGATPMRQHGATASAPSSTKGRHSSPGNGSSTKKRNSHAPHS